MCVCMELTREPGDIVKICSTLSKMKMCDLNSNLATY